MLSLRAIRGQVRSSCLYRLEYRVRGLGFIIHCLVVQIQSEGFRGEGLQFRVKGLG
jgi:hypothetical protein